MYVILIMFILYCLCILLEQFVSVYLVLFVYIIGTICFCLSCIVCVYYCNNLFVFLFYAQSCSTLNIRLFKILLVYHLNLYNSIQSIYLSAFLSTYLIIYHRLALVRISVKNIAFPSCFSSSIQ